jgi:intracellular sulfur oxidation DsrE/DsrF family protein
MAASIVLAIGIFAGWIAHDGQGDARLSALQLYARHMDDGKVILHLSSASPDRLKVALDEATELAQTRDHSGHLVQVELVANGAGLALVRADLSPYADRIAALRRAHVNVRFVACDNTITILRQQGEDVTLLPGVDVAPTAVDQIMMRLQQGWAYIRV